MTEINENGRGWLLQLAGWFKANAGQAVTIDAEAAEKIAKGLRDLATSGDVTADLEQWYARQEGK